MELTAPLVDTHAHLDDSRLSEQISAVVTRAHEAGLVQMVAIGTTASDSVSTIGLASCYPGIFAAVGIHPNDAASASPTDWQRIVELAKSPRVVALGETGLDRYRDRTPFDVQQDFFDRHLDLAEELGLPVVIHCRDCQRDVISQIARRGRPISGVQHSFTGTWDDAIALIDLGLHLSFAGMITFQTKNLDPLRDVAARAPIERILVETDSPYLSPHPFRGKLNEPARVAFTALKLAELRGVTFEELARATTANARRVFRLPEEDRIRPSG